jgi:hypothetical protein
VQAPGRVEDDDAEAGRGCPLQALANRRDRIGALLAEDRDLDLAAELLELVDRGRPLTLPARAGTGKGAALDN